MWWQTEHRGSKLRSAAIAVAAGLAFTALGGCAGGFKPLYGVTQDGGQVATELAYVAIPEKRNRLDQLIRNQLLTTMAPPGGPLDDKYVLEFVADSDIKEAVIESNGDVSRRLFILNVEYRLIDNASDKVVHQGKTFSHVAYDRVRSEFANIQADTDVRERASIQVADDIRTRLAVYFSSL